jgi:uroporphyrinogen-III synthase
MRVLVLRPQQDAEQTAKLLEIRGHEAIIAPVIEIEIETLNIGAMNLESCNAVIATSANSFRCLSDEVANKIKNLPCFTVGSHTYEAAISAGFTLVKNALGDVDVLVKMVCSTLPKEKQFLYLTGQPRKPELETILKQHGFGIMLCETYKTNAVNELPATAIKALHEGVDVILHFSKRSAQIAFMLFEKSGLLHKAQAARHICLSSDVASGLVNCPQVEIASKPEQLGLLDLI